MASARLGLLLLGLLLAASLWAAGARAQTAGPPLSESAAEAATAALSAGPKAVQTLRAVLERGSPTPDQVAERAVEIMQAIRQQAGNDLLVLQQALTQVEAQAALALRAAPVMRLGVLDNFSVPAGVFAYDLGPAASPPAPGFVRLAPGDAGLVGNGMQAVAGPPGDFLADGVIGLRGLNLPLPAGDWRVILLVGDAVRGDSAMPFGEQVSINGQTVAIGGASPADGLATGFLTALGGLEVSSVERLEARLLVGLRADGVAQASQGAALPNGVAVARNVTVEGQTLNLRFDPAPGQQTALSALLLEPVASRSVLAPTPALAQALARSEAAILAAEAAIQAQLASLLTEVATAAGASPSELAALFQPGAPPPIEPNAAASPN